MKSNRYIESAGIEKRPGFRPGTEGAKLVVKTPVETLR
jgi:hypothetical protein